MGDARYRTPQHRPWTLWGLKEVAEPLHSVFVFITQSLTPSWGRRTLAGHDAWGPCKEETGCQTQGAPGCPESPY